MSSGSNQQNIHSNILSALEGQMKELWSQYVNRLDKEGPTDRAVALRKKYYDLYRAYRQHRDWRNRISN